MLLFFFCYYHYWCIGPVTKYVNAVKNGWRQPVVKIFNKVVAAIKGLEDKQFRTVLEKWLKNRAYYFIAEFFEESAATKYLKLTIFLQTVLVYIWHNLSLQGLDE